ncbi:MAG TPA: hypothetical protein VIF62_28155 [Labilithrix sp.]|jgi:hypothetical protein
MSGNFDVTAGNFNVTAENKGVRPEHVRAVRLGHGANCSSVGSVVDTLFVSAAVGGVLLAVILAAMKGEPVRVAGQDDDERAKEPPP